MKHRHLHQKREHASTGSRPRALEDFMRFPTRRGHLSGKLGTVVVKLLDSLVPPAYFYYSFNETPNKVYLHLRSV